MGPKQALTTVSRSHKAQRLNNAAHQSQTPQALKFMFHLQLHLFSWSTQNIHLGILLLILHVLNPTLELSLTVDAQHR